MNLMIKTSLQKSKMMMILN